MSHAVKRILTVILLLIPYGILGVIGALFLTSPAPALPIPHWLPVADVASLPMDGQPLRVPIHLPDRDAWTRLPDQIRGHVFLRRIPEEGVVALRGHHHSLFHIPVKFDVQAQCFRSTCWPVRFDLDGKEIVSNSPLDQQMKPLNARVVGDQVFISYVDWASSFAKPKMP